jgi:hypothetical protein
MGEWRYSRSTILDVGSRGMFTASHAEKKAQGSSWIGGLRDPRASGDKKGFASARNRTLAIQLVARLK